MHYLKKFPLMLLLFCISFPSCQKEEPTFLSKKESPLKQSPTFRTSSGAATQLGKKRINPYAVQNMTAAWNQLYPNHPQTKLPVTDLYVRFHPKTPQEYQDLQNAIDVYDPTSNEDWENDPFLYDYPLEYEITQMGNFYHDPSIPQDQITYQYAVVPPDFNFPAGVEYTVLSELVLTPYHSILTAEAFRRTSNDYYDDKGELMSFCDPSCNNYPACLRPEIDCNDGTIQPLGYPCAPSSPLWPHCMGAAYLYPSPPTTTGPPNECGCPIDRSAHQPGGCVQVEDTQLGWEGVKSVQVHVKDTWFTGRSTWTSNEGCWRIYVNHFAPVQVFVKYISNRMKICGLWNNYLTEFGHPIIQNTGIHRTGYYNIKIRHHRHPDNDRIERLLWFASQTNNAVYEYDYYAAQEGLPPAAPDMNILVSNLNGGAAAPMLNHIMRTNPGVAMTVGGVVAFGATTGTFTGALFVDAFLPGANILVSTALPVFLAHLLTNMPDMVYLYGSRGTAITSDKVKEVMYHECAHSSHYYALSNKNEYWMTNIKRIVDNGGYGNEGTTEYERCAIIEAWGYHIGNYFADLHYGKNNQVSALYTTFNKKERKRFVYRVSEKDNPKNTSEPDLYWLQKGLYWDLMDDRSHNNPPLEITDPVKDSVSGFTNAEIFNAMTNNSPTLAHQVRDALKSIHPTQSDFIDTLYKEYGY